MKITAFLQKKPEVKATNVDIREAFTLWDILNSKYTTKERLLMFISFAEDPELRLLLGKREKEIDQNITILQKQMKMYNIISPGKKRAAVPSRLSKELMNDENIAMLMLLYEQEHAENLLIATYSIITNDNLRKVITDMLMRTLHSADQVMTHAAIRGWVGIPPAYQHLPADTTEKIHCGEAGCLWDMLTYRYDTLHFTEIMSSIINDNDLKLIFASGIQILKKQIKHLEKELVYFGISLPNRPADITIALNNRDLWEDSHIYRITLMGMQGAAALHVRSFKRMSSNHRLRKFMITLLREEVEKINDFIRYGKIKGWLQPVPRYGP